MKNVMRVEGESMLIDMDTLTAGDPIFDLQGIYMTYREFGEDDPSNSMSFRGIDERTSEFVWKKSIAGYFLTEDANILTCAADRIRLVAAMRFLTYLDPADAEGDSLNARRIRHTTANIRELLTRTDSLLLDAPGGAR